MRAFYAITPIAKPRQTQSDRWKKRPSVLRYRAFADECRAHGVQLHESGCHVIFHLPMPKSWSAAQKRRSVSLPHRSRPDIDNLLKALLDAVMSEDSAVWDIRATKQWSYSGAIEITVKANALSGQSYTDLARVHHPSEKVA